MNIITNFLTTIIFGVRAQGEPVDFYQSLPPERSGEGFFEWSREYRVGCQAKSGAVFY